MDDRQALEGRILDLETAQLSSRRRMRRLTATNALLAVVVLAFGGAGTAYAVAAANSVNSASIIDGSILYADLKDGALGGKKILDNSITSPKIANNTLTGDDINEQTLAIKQVLAARVSAYGNEEPSDDATDASKISTGVYTVTFPRTLSSCVLVASVSDYGGLYNNYGNAVVEGINGNTAAVKISRPHVPTNTTGQTPSDLTDSGFNIVAVCD